MAHAVSGGHILARRETGEATPASGGSVGQAGSPTMQRTTHRGQRAGTAAVRRLGEGAAVFTRSVSSSPKAALRSPIASASW